MKKNIVLVTLKNNNMGDSVREMKKFIEGCGEKEQTSEDVSFGILGYNSINIGDDIQSVAATRFLPRIDEWVFREQTHKFLPGSGKKTKCIMNAWWMWRPKNFPPSKWLAPLLISMHIRPAIQKKFLTPETRKYLTDHGPVGCRDMETCEWLQKENIPAYFSGCLTLTLQRNHAIPRQNYILCVDVDPQVVEKIRKRTDKPVYAVSRMLSSCYSPRERHELAKLMLRLYHDAHLVVSPRLHVILPSLALETPVCRIKSNDTGLVGDTSRYSGFEDFCNSINVDSSLSELDNFDFDNPPPNPAVHLAMRNDLIARCARFTGYDNKESLIENEPFPLIKVMQLNKYSYSSVKKMLYFAKENDFFAVFKYRICGADRFEYCHDMSFSSKRLRFFWLKLLRRLSAIKLAK